MLHLDGHSHANLLQMSLKIKERYISSLIHVEEETDVACEICSPLICNFLQRVLNPLIVVIH